MKTLSTVALLLASSWLATPLLAAEPPLRTANERSTRLRRTTRSDTVVGAADRWSTS